MSDNLICPYESKYYRENQKNIIDGIPIDPILRDNFNSIEHRLRDKKELIDWWGKPFIYTIIFNEINYFDYCNTSESFLEDKLLETIEEFTTRIDKEREAWLQSWKNGIRYDVLCLTGQDRDKASLLGSFSTLDKSLSLAKEINKTLDNQFLNKRLI